MAEAIDGPREKLSQHAPAIESIKIDPEKIGKLIGAIKRSGATVVPLKVYFNERGTNTYPTPQTVWM